MIPPLGAVQLRKAVGADSNWLTRSQALEMAFDAEMQLGRIAQGALANCAATVS